MADPVVYQKAPIVQDMDVGKYWWCACGRSQGQPFCDGSHKGTGLAPLEVNIPARKKVAWCACKKTKTPPFCDGTHKSLG